MRFKYSSKTKDTYKTKQGEVEAPSRREAAKILQENGLIIYSLVPLAKRHSPLTIILNLRGVTLGEKVKFTEQLASMVTAGLPLTKTLDLLASQIKNNNLLTIVKKTLNDVESGIPLSSSLAKFPKVFSKSYISLIKAGEASGKLDNVLSRLAETLEKQRQFRSKVKGALVYPAIITIAMIAVLIIVIVFVIPKMNIMYESLDLDLPASTKFIIALSNFVINYWWAILLTLAGTITGLKFFKNSEAGRYIFARFIFKVPIFGNLVKQAGLVEFTRTLALLVESGVPIIESLEIVKGATGNILYREAIGRFIEDIKHGYPLSASIAKEEDFPMLVSQMIVVGEETGTVGERFASLSKYFEGEVDNIVKNLSTAMEPIIMVLIGIMVTVLIFAVITPIYQLTSQF